MTRPWKVTVVVLAVIVGIALVRAIPPSWIFTGEDPCNATLAHYSGCEPG